MSSNNSIAKNTIFLYFRMLLVLGVSLFTSRIVLKELGVSDYGIYSLVGGFITVFSFLNTAMTAATQRYLTFDLGTNDLDKLQKTFSATLSIHIGIALFVLIMAETIGLWYLNHKMVYPPERSYAVNFVYQFSIASTLLGIIQVPYNALIIAREKMNIYAYVGIVEVFLKLLVVFLLVYFGNDKLIFYSIMTFAVALGIRIFYQIYCRKNYKESKYKFEWEPIYYKELIYYSGWNLFGSMAVIAKDQGSNLVLNLFFGTIINAAYGIMNTVNSAVNSFIANFLLAANPQIIKLYATGDKPAMEKLINQTSKFSFFLSLFLIAPIFLNINYILNIWLIEPPPYAGTFIRLALLCTIIDTVTKPVITGIHATGKIRNYQIVVGLFNFLNLPLSYFLLKFKIFSSPEIILYIWLVFASLSMLFRLYFLNKTMGYDLRTFFYAVLFRITIVSLFIIAVGSIINKIFMVTSFLSFLTETIFYCGIIFMVIFFFGIEKEEKGLLVILKDRIFRK